MNFSLAAVRRSSLAYHVPFPRQIDLSDRKITGPRACKYPDVIQATTKQ